MAVIRESLGSVFDVKALPSINIRERGVWVPGIALFSANLCLNAVKIMSIGSENNEASPHERWIYQRGMSEMRVHIEALHTSISWLFSGNTGCSKRDGYSLIVYLIN